MNTKEIIAMTEAHYLPVFGRFPIAIDHGEGATLYDADGKAYIDFLAGIATNALGYHHPAIVKAVCEQTQKGYAYVKLVLYGNPGQGGAAAC